MFVNDCAEAIRRITENGKLGEIYNIGTDFEMANLHVTQMIHKVVSEIMDR